MPGEISVTADAWTADITSASYFGMTGHWIEVKDDKWKLQSIILGFKVISDDVRYHISYCKIYA